MTFHRRFTITAVVIAAAACSEGNLSGPDKPEPRGIVISNSRLSSSAASFAGIQTTSVVSQESSIAYVSAEPGTYADSTTVSIKNRSAASSVKAVQVIDGGFDPVAIAAQAGDALELTVSVAGGVTTVTELKVPPRRPPAVVRSSPAKGRVDVAVNSVSISIVFSEPIDPKTLNTTSVRLLHDGKAVSGTIRLLENGWAADFSPDELLEPLTNYDLIVTQDIRDLDGDPLEGSYSSTFTTGQSLCPKLDGLVFSSELLTGCYLDVTRSLGPIWLVLNQLDGRLGVVWNYFPFDPDWSSPDIWAAGEYSSTSSAGTFGTVKLHLYVSGTRCARNVCSHAEYLIEAEVTKADGSELSGKWVFWDYETGTPSADDWKPIVLKRFSK